MKAQWQLMAFSSARRLLDLIFQVLVTWSAPFCEVPVLPVTQLICLKLSQSREVSLASRILLLLSAWVQTLKGNGNSSEALAIKLAHVHIFPFPHSGHDWGLLSIKDIQNDFIDTSSSTFTMKLIEEVNAIIDSCTQQDFIVDRA